jgi:glutathione peroxidase
MRTHTALLLSALGVGSLLGLGMIAAAPDLGGGFEDPAKAEPTKKDTHTAPPAAPANGKKPADDKSQPSEAQPVSAQVLNYTVKTIDGKDQKLSDYRGKVVVIVNVASKCGFTTQYEGLEKLYKDKKDQGLVILGFPANNFGGQEPGSNADIKQFCDSTYHVDFPMFEKISVKEKDQHPLYKQLAAQPAPIGGEPKWNFTKFVVDRDGNVVARFDADKKNVRTANLEDGLLKKVDELLAKKATPAAAEAPAPTK